MATGRIVYDDLYMEAELDATMATTTTTTQTARSRGGREDKLEVSATHLHEQVSVEQLRRRPPRTHVTTAGIRSSTRSSSIKRSTARSPSPSPSPSPSLTRGQPSTKPVLKKKITSQTGVNRSEKRVNLDGECGDTDSDVAMRSFDGADYRAAEESRGEPPTFLESVVVPILLGIIPLLHYLVDFVELMIGLMTELRFLAAEFWIYAKPYKLELLLPSLVGLVMCFFGGSFVTLIAAVEAYHLLGFHATWNAGKRVGHEIRKFLRAAAKKAQEKRKMKLLRELQLSVQEEEPVHRLLHHSTSSHTSSPLMSPAHTTADKKGEKVEHITPEQQKKIEMLRGQHYGSFTNRRRQSLYGRLQTLEGKENSGTKSANSANSMGHRVRKDSVDTELMDEREGGGGEEGGAARGRDLMKRLRDLSRRMSASTAATSSSLRTPNTHNRDTAAAAAGTGTRLPTRSSGGASNRSPAEGGAHRASKFARSPSSGAGSVSEFDEDDGETEMVEYDTKTEERGALTSPGGSLGWDGFAEGGAGGGEGIEASVKMTASAVEYFLSPESEGYKEVALLFFQTVDPHILTEALTTINAGFLAVLATLKMQFAKAITLGNAIATIVEVPADTYLLPILERSLPAECRQWAAPTLSYSIKSVAITIAWTVQRVISAFHSAMRGGLMFSRNIIHYLSELGILHVDPKDTYIDEIFGYIIAGMGLYFQLMMGFSLPFPLSIVLLPFSFMEWSLFYLVTSSK